MKGGENNMNSFKDLLNQLQLEQSPEAIPYESPEDAAMAEINPLTSSRTTPVPEPIKVDPTQANRDVLFSGLKSILPSNSPLMKSQSDVLTPEARALANAQKPAAVTMEEAEQNSLNNYKNSAAALSKKDTVPTQLSAPSRAPANIETAPTSSSSMTKTSQKISGTIPNDTEAPKDAESRLEQMMKELAAERSKQIEDAQSRQLRANVMQSIVGNIGGLVGGSQAMNTGAAVQAPKVAGLDIGDLVGQVDKRFAGDQEALLNQYKMLMNARDKAEQRKFQQESLNVQREGNNLKRDIATMKNEGNNSFGKAQMSALGKNSAEYFTKDRDQLINNNSKISEAIKLMGDAVKSGENLSGGISEYILGSDTLRPMINEKGEIVKNSMDSAITETLRPTLGAQFTENEGERIKALQYNPKLPPEENARRARELQKFINKKLQATDALYEHLGAGKPLKSFDFKRFGMQEQGQSSSNVEDKVSAFMQKNGISDREEAIKILKDAGKL